MLRNRFEKEINNFVPDFRAEFSEKIAGLEKENRRLRGMLNHLSGKLAESQLTNELRTRKRFRFADYFAGGTDAELLNIIAVQERVTFQRTDGKGQELDVVAEADNGRTLLIEVRKRQAPTALTDVADFWDKVTAWRQQFPAKVALPAFLSLGGFTAEAQAFCAERHIGVAESIAYH